MVTFSFFTCPLNFNVFGCVIHVIAVRVILGMSSSGSIFGISFSSLPSFEPLLYVIDSFSALQEYIFLLLHLCLGDHLSSQYLHLFNHLLSGSYSLKGGGTHLSVGYFYCSFKYLFDLSRPVNDDLLNLFFCSINFATCPTSSIDFGFHCLSLLYL